MDAKNKIYKGGEGLYSAALELDALIRSSSQRGGGGSGRRPITKLKIDSHTTTMESFFSYFSILIEKEKRGMKKVTIHFFLGRFNSTQITTSLPNHHPQTTWKFLLAAISNKIFTK